MNRRQFVLRSANAAGALSVGACVSGAGVYKEQAELARQSMPESGNFRELVRFASLAANGHNTQPWKFRVRQGEIRVLPDFTRRTPVVDPDDHHLYASLGCASENLSLAALATGQSGAVRIDPAQDGSVIVDLSPTRAQDSSLFRAITQRQCTRSIYEEKPVQTEILDRLQQAANNYGVEAILLIDQKRIDDITSLVIEGNTQQLADPAFIAELKQWLRFNPKSAAAHGDGLFGGAAGNPSVPDWIGPMAFRLTFNPKAENKKVAKQISSSSGVVIFVAASNNMVGWVSAGRAYERFALQATADGLKTAFINQATEVPGVRQQLQALLGIGAKRPNLIVRFGYAPAMPRSPRRPVASVIV